MRYKHSSISFTLPVSDDSSPPSFAHALLCWDFFHACKRGRGQKMLKTKGASTSCSSAEFSSATSPLNAFLVLEENTVVECKCFITMCLGGLLYSASTHADKNLMLLFVLMQSSSPGCFSERVSEDD